MFHAFLRYELREITSLKLLEYCHDLVTNPNDTKWKDRVAGPIFKLSHQLASVIEVWVPKALFRDTEALSKSIPQ